MRLHQDRTFESGVLLIENYVSTAHDQRQVVETFVNEVLTRNTERAIHGLGPLVYEPCKDMW